MAAGRILNFKSKIKFDARNDLSDTEIPGVPTKTGPTLTLITPKVLTRNH